MSGEKIKIAPSMRSNGMTARSTHCSRFGDTCVLYDPVEPHCDGGTRGHRW